MPKRLDATDSVISRNIRLHRLAKKMTQSELGAALDVTFQQVQKYERGANRVSSGRLLRIAHILDVDLLTLLGTTNNPKKIPNTEFSPLDLIAEPQSLRLVTMFASIKDADLHRCLVTLTTHLARLSKSGASQ